MIAGILSFIAAVALALAPIPSAKSADGVEIVICSGKGSFRIPFVNGDENAPQNQDGAACHAACFRDRVRRILKKAAA